MKKFLFILSCFIAGTCGIERSFAGSTDVDAVLKEGETLSLQAQNNLINAANSVSGLNQNNSNLPANLLPAIHKPFEDFLLNNASPLASSIIGLYKTNTVDNNTDPDTILHLITSQAEESLREVLSKITSNDTKKFILTQVVNYSIAEAIKCAAQGASFNLASPNQLSLGSKSILAELDIKAWNAIGQTLCNILKKNLTNFRLQAMNQEERYAYNQFLGFLVWNIGLKGVEEQYQEEFRKAIAANDDKLARSILIQIRHAYYWAMLRNPAKAESLVKRYNSFYITGQFKQKFSKFYQIKCVKEIDDLNGLKSLFQCFTDGVITLEETTDQDELFFRETFLGNKFNIDANSVSQPYLGAQCTASPRGNECYAISGLVPLLAKGLVSAPRLELNIMDITSQRIDKPGETKKESVELDTDVLNMAFGMLEQSYQIAYSHLGYMPLEIQYFQNKKKCRSISSLITTTSIFPFLPIYFATLANSHYEMLCRSVCEALIKKEVSEIKSAGISDKIKKLVNKYQLGKYGFIDSLQKYKSSKSAEDLKSIQHQVDKLADDSYFKATDENSIDPRLSIFSQRTDNFAYRK